MTKLIIATLFVLLSCRVAVAIEAKSGVCWLVDFYVNKYGEDAAFEYAQKNNWTESKINAACTCVNPKPKQCASRRAGRY